MKIIIRTLIILVAALVVVAAAVGFAQSSFAVALAPGMPAEQRGAAPVLVTGTETAGAETAGAETAGADANGSAAAFTIAGGGFRPDHDGAGGVQGSLPLAKNFAIVALIVGVVALSSQGFDRLRHRRMQSQAR